MTVGLAGSVLCGGRSRRMGRDKATLDIGGEPMVVRVARRVSAAADPVVLVGGPASVRAIAPADHPHVADALPDAGPLAGLVAALDALTASAPGRLVAVVAVDMPFASPALLAALARMASGAGAVVPVTDDGMQPLHAVYAASAARPLMAALARGVRSIRDALAELDDVRLVGEDEWRAHEPDATFAWNVNTPGDLARARAMLASEHRTTTRARGGSR